MRFMIFIYQRQMKTLTNFVYDNIILIKIHLFSPVELAPIEFTEILIKPLLNRKKNFCLYWNRDIYIHIYVF